MSERVAITGIGVTSAIGLSAKNCLNALRNHKTGIAPIEFLQTSHSEYVAGEVKYSNEALYDYAQINITEHHTSRTVLLGLIAAREALIHAHIDTNQWSKCGMINGTTVGGMDISEVHYEAFLKGSSMDYKKSFASHDCGFITEKIMQHLGLRGLNTTISTACSSASNAIMLAARKIKHGTAHQILAGGTDALSIFTFNGFNTLQILDPHACKPFDKNRKGLNLGEGAGYLLLESESSAIARGANILGFVTGYGNANDAHHQTASTDEGIGAQLAMNWALQCANKKPDDIDYINVHGTGTPNNDLSEGQALNHIFQNNVPAFSSTKSFTGHTLGAAGGVEAVFSILAITNNLCFANLNFEHAIEEIKIAPVSAMVPMEQKEINTVMSNSFGFGGNCTSLIFEKS